MNRELNTEYSEKKIVWVDKNSVLLKKLFTTQKFVTRNSASVEGSFSVQFRG